MPYRYRKEERLRKNRDFIAAMKGKRLSFDGLSLFYAPNGMEHFRVGISVGKKLANAVGRNRLRRQLRNCISRSLKDHSRGFDLVFVARRELVTHAYQEISRIVEQTLRRTVLRPVRSEGPEQ